MNASRGGSYLSFQVQGQSYGVPVSAVREITRASGILPVPESPSHVAGVVRSRGRVIPVVDLSAKFGNHGAPITAESCLLVVELLAGHAGTLVDRVSGIIEIPEGEIRPSQGKPHVHAIVNLGGKEVMLVDLMGLLSAEDLSRARQYKP